MIMMRSNSPTMREASDVPSAVTSRAGSKDKSADSIPAATTTASSPKLTKKSSAITLENKPVRNLTAYNFYFQHQRQKILEELTPSSEGNSTKTPSQSLPLTLEAARASSVRANKQRAVPHGKIGFADLARKIGAKWTAAPAEERAPYVELAREDKERYEREMEIWKALEREDRKKRARDEEEDQFSSSSSEQENELDSSFSSSQKSGRRSSKTKSSNRLSKKNKKAKYGAGNVSTTLQHHHLRQDRSSSMMMMHPDQQVGSQRLLSSAPMFAPFPSYLSAPAQQSQSNSNLLIASNPMISDMGGLSSPQSQQQEQQEDCFASTLAELRARKAALAECPTTFLGCSATDNDQSTDFDPIPCDPPAATDIIQDVSWGSASHSNSGRQLTASNNVNNNVSFLSTQGMLAAQDEELSVLHDLRLVNPNPTAGFASMTSSPRPLEELAGAMGEDCTSAFVNLFRQDHYEAV